MQPFMERLDFIWSLSNVPSIRTPYLQAVSNEDHRRIFSKAIDDFEQEIVPKLSCMQKGYVHGDINQHNIILDHGTREIKGIIDFSALSYSYSVFDLVIAMYYIGIVRPDDFVQIAGQVLKGYNEIFPVNELELEVLFKLVLCRMTQSVSIGEYKYHVLDPGNEYLLADIKPALVALKVLTEMGEEQVTKRWRAEISL